MGGIISMIILLGETTAAREINERIKKRGLEFMRAQIWAEEKRSQLPSIVIDASHPSISYKFVQLRQLCAQRGIPYLVFEQPETNIPTSPLIYPVFNWDGALMKLEQRVSALCQEKRRTVTIFVTTGSHQLESIVGSLFSQSARLVVRVLPEVQVVRKCKEMGVRSKDIVAMQGPFSKEINKALFRFYKTDILLTRDSGTAGGTDTKISAALELGIEIVLLKRTKESKGLIMNDVHQLMTWLDENFSEELSV